MKDNVAPLSEKIIQIKVVEYLYKIYMAEFMIPGIAQRISIPINVNWVPNSLKK